MSLGPANDVSSGSSSDDTSQLAGAVPFLVHLPSDWPKLRKLITAGREIVGFVPKYKAKCSGRKVSLPPATVVRDCDGQPYFVCGPHPRYYERCPGCFAGHQLP